MGFYSAATLVADARRHGVEVLRPDLRLSGALDGMEALGDDRRPSGLDACLERDQPPIGDFDRNAPDVSASHRRDSAFAVRLGLAGVKGVGTATAERIVAEREAHGHYLDLNDLARRTGATAAQLEALATAGAFDCFGLTRREAIWLAGSAAQERPELLPGTAVSVQPPLFPDPTSFEMLADDLWATGVSTDDHPIAHFRPALDERGVLPSAALRTAETGRRIEVAGLVTHRQRPATASGITFLNLEDEHGLINVICSMGVWTRHRRVVRDSHALIVRGMLERSPEGVTNLLADGFEDLQVGVRHASRDFH
jgi:error-prone DNA polymerase